MEHAPEQLLVAIAGLPDTPARHVSVDGMTPEGPNLSHWPGNRTPPELKADLTTGICLEFARRDPHYRAEFLAGVEAVVNDHYDTDGFLSMLALVRPEVALARAELCLEAAATGDYQAFQSERGFAIDRIVRGLPAHPESPIADRIADLDPLVAWEVCYRWLIEHAEEVLDRPGSLDALYRDELGQVIEQLAIAGTDRVTVEHEPTADLAVVTSPFPLHRMVLNTIAERFRVLHFETTPEGSLVRYHDRTESWFEVVTFEPPPRVDLGPLAERLAAIEPAGRGEWCADSPREPVPELYHGMPGTQVYGEITRERTPTQLPAGRIRTAFVDHLAAGATIRRPES